MHVRVYVRQVCQVCIRQFICLQTGQIYVFFFCPYYKRLLSSMSLPHSYTPNTYGFCFLFCLFLFCFAMDTKESLNFSYEYILSYLWFNQQFFNCFHVLTYGIASSYSRCRLTWKYGGPHILITVCANEMKLCEYNAYVL